MNAIVFFPSDWTTLQCYRWIWRYSPAPLYIKRQKDGGYRIVT